MRYVSTRGRAPELGFADVLLAGLANDGGLYVPASWPKLAPRSSSSGSYVQRAVDVMLPFVEPDIDEITLTHLCTEAYSTFRHPAVVPLIQTGENQWVQELFHGPTLAFKDVAMQFLSGVFDYVLEERDQTLNILGSTSGDTGSAAIHGVRGKHRINIFMMHPKGRTSLIQEKQMTSVLDDNVFNIAVDGTFDDCQRIMKSIFSDVDFKQTHTLGAVNSVNWARVLAQVVYYFFAAFRVQEMTDALTVQVAVPTGNFGNILAGYYAQRMGAPIERLILATNENDILARFFNTGEYSSGNVAHTLSPSMDIQVASNFERYLYYRLNADSDRVENLLTQFAETGSIRLEKDRAAGMDDLFRAGVSNQERTMQTIHKYFDQYDYMLDPHTAVGVSVAEELADDAIPVVCLATAHPAKFGEAILNATGCDPHHETLDNLTDARTRCTDLPNDEQAVRDFIVEKT